MVSVHMLAFVTLAMPLLMNSASPIQSVASSAIITATVNPLVPNATDTAVGAINVGIQMPCASIDSWC